MSTIEETQQYQYTPMQIHMVQLYRIYRYVDLNVRYYGCRADEEDRKNKCIQGVSAVGSSVTIVGLLKDWPIGWLILTAAAALASALSPLLGLTEKVIRFEKLHYAYSELLADFKTLIRDIELAGRVTAEHKAVSAVLFDRYSRLSALDEVKPNEQLKDELTEAMNKAIPPESLWMPSE